MDAGLAQGVAEHLLPEGLPRHGHVVVDADPDVHRDRDRAGVTAGPGDALADPGPADRDVLGRRPVEQRAVGGFAGQPEHLRAERGQVHRSRRQVRHPERRRAGPAGHAPAGGACHRLAGRDGLAGQQRADLGDVLAHQRDRAVRQADRGPEPGPVAARAQAEDEPAGGELSQGGRLRREAQRGPHPRCRDDGDRGAQRGVLRPRRADMERVRHAPGRGPQALETKLPGLPRGRPQLVERQTEPGIQSRADQPGTPGGGFGCAGHAGRLEFG